MTILCRQFKANFPKVYRAKSRQGRVGGFGNEIDIDKALRADRRPRVEPKTKRESSCVQKIKLLDDRMTAWGTTHAVNREAWPLMDRNGNIIKCM